MKLYLLNILQSNTVEEVKSLKDILKEFEGKFNLYQSSVEDAMKYLTQLAFTDSKERDKLADKIQHIAFEYDTIEYDEELYKKFISGEIKVNLETKPKKHSPSKYEIKLDSWLQKNEITFIKHYQEFIAYDLILKNNIQASIFLDYKGKWIQAAIEKGDMIVCPSKAYMDEALGRILKNIEKIQNN